MADASKIMKDWPEESKEAAGWVLQKYGDPDEATDSLLIWHHPGSWKRMLAYRDFKLHNFPAPHIDAVESVLEYRVPPEKVSELTEFDGSVVFERTLGEISARCHDEEANSLAINLAHDIIMGTKTVQEAREYYAHEFLAWREKEPTPYMNGLQFTPTADGDPDHRLLSDEQLKEAVAKGKAKGEKAA